MPTLEITDEQRERIEALRADIADHHAGAYAAVGTTETLSYLLDLADAVDDPDRSADPERLSGDHDGSGADAPDDETLPFERETVRSALASRNRRHGDPDDADRMDLYTIAAEFDVTGRSEMTKDELVEGILDAAARAATDPFAAVGVDLDRGADAADETRGPDDGDSADGDADPDGDIEDDASGGPADGDTATADDDSPDGDADTADDTDDAPGAAASDAGSSQLNAMMSLLDTHDDKWRDGDGDARYEVELPDGRVETARTKDDVRALLFRHY
jgi:hypothetical protein